MVSLIHVDIWAKADAESGTRGGDGAARPDKLSHRGVRGPITC
jgi:hypothetical protein